ncbi:MAG: DNA alkylation repair protein [Clostridiaceae bacterium]|nr:DNA alkylation repair protein [Clostridiaceae bacterium]
MKNEIKERLKSLADEKYRSFSSGLIPGVDNMLGVRLPQIRGLVKEIAAADWRSYLEEADDEYFEEIMLRGFIIGSVRIDAAERLQLVEDFVPRISNWSLCDSFCAGLKFVNENQALVWEFLQPYFKSDEEFEIRFAVVMGMDYFIDGEHIDDFIKLMDGIKNDGYYVKMAVAWALSVCYVKFPEKTMAYLKDNRLDDFTYNKALQKMIESYRVSSEAKDLLRSMKRK